MKAVILAAGESTRTRPLTLTRPKSLLTVANRTLLDYLVESLSNRGVKDILLVVGHKKEMIEEYVHKNYKNLNFSFIEQTDRNGTAKAIGFARDFANEPFIVLNGDVFFDEEVLDLMIHKYDSTGDCVVCSKEVENPERYGVFEVQDDYVTKVVEKPKEPKSNLANMGLYLFTPEVFNAIDKTGVSERGEFEITDSLQILIDSGKKVRFVTFEGFYLDAGYPWTLLDINSYILSKIHKREIDGTVEDGATIKGNVVIGKGTMIKAGAYIEGPVVIGRNCSVGPNCFIRPGSAIGDDCFVGNGCEIKNSILMNGTHIAHLCYVGDSVLGEGVNFSGGTITANLRHDGSGVKSMVKGKLVDSGRRKLGTIVGDGVKTGVNTTIYPGRKIWPHKSTLPAEVVKKDIE